MKFKILGMGLEITPAMREKIEKRISKLEKYFVFDEDTEARVVVRGEPHNKIEVTIPTSFNTLRSEVLYEDFYSGVDDCVEKLEKQIKKMKGKLNKLHRKDLVNDFQAEFKEESKDMFKIKECCPDELSLEEAVLQLELLDHDFYIFTDIDTHEHAVLYRKKNNHGYGVIYIK